MSEHKFGFETLQLHVGQEKADPATDSRAVPIYQTTSYVFHNAQHAADRFGLRDAGNIYGRLTNSTQAVLEDRLAALEGGVAGLAVASGAAAVTYAVTALAGAGDHIVAQKTIYGGSYNLLKHTLPGFGISTTFVNARDLKEVEAAIQPNTKAVFIETLTNPELRHSGHRCDRRDRPSARTSGHRGQHLRHPLPDPPDRARRRCGGPLRNEVHRRPRLLPRRHHRRRRHL
jgi:O-acetylhomoserine (thiol)-lyase